MTLVEPGVGVDESTQSMLLDQIAEYVFQSKYARYLPNLKRRETWEETVARVEKMHLDHYDYLLSDEDCREIRRAFDLVRAKTVVPSMRSMQFGGVAIEAKNERMYNCLGVETSFITSEGVKTFADFSDGDEVLALGHSGRWLPAIVRNYGKGVLHPVVVNRAKSTSTVWATEDHRWMRRDGTVGEGVKAGEYLRGGADLLSEFDWDTADWDEQLYWAYGYVYGDGTRVKTASGDYRYSMVRLCGAEAARYEYRFEGLGFKTSRPLSCGGDVMVYTGAYQKVAPDPSVDDPRLVRAFVRGYLDADGEKNGNANSKNLFHTIQSSDLDHIDFIRRCFPVAGVYIVSEEELTGQVTNYGARPYTVRFRLVNHFYNDTANSAARFTVAAVGEDERYDDLWCLEVKEDHTFTLANGLVTGNCAVRHIDSLRSFAESFYLLLCGCGVGFGLTNRFLDRLPALVGPEDKSGTVLTYVVEDTIEGWADSLEALLMCYFKNTPFTGRKFVPDFSKIRKAGSPLKTSGGKAPGHLGLKNALLKIKALLDRIIEEEGILRLRTIDAYDILMHAADAVLSGGVRRSACAVIFDKDDELMMNAKVGDWRSTNPQRARSNNSVMLLRSEMTEDEVKSVIERTKEWGEPGFVFADDPNTLYNPCFEVSFIPMTDDGVCGVQFCNLTSITATHLTDEEKFQEAVWAATVIGTLQAGYTNFPYLGHVAEDLTRSESLLGVSMTAVYDNPEIALDPGIQRRGALHAVQVNEEWALKLDINPAARVTLEKPEGTSTIARRSVASGMKPAHAHRMWRRVQCNKLDTPYQFFRQYNPHLCEPSVWSENKTDDVIAFPLYISESAMVQSDLDALRHLEDIRSTQENWVIPGTTRHNTKPIHHNVSCTVVVEEDEWDMVAKYLYEHRASFAAVSLLAATGDKDYAQAPNEAVVTPEEIALWEEQIRNMIPVDYTLMIEDEDGTSLAQEFSCAGGACEVV